MCGIILGINFPNKKGEEVKPINEWIINQLQDQFSRGKEGFGSVFLDEKEKLQTLRATEPTKAMLDLYMNKSRMILTHHRMPTSSENKLSQTHPIVVDNGSLKHKYLFVHNGIITNEDELKEKHEKLGFIYTTIREKTWKYNNSIDLEFNDSESAAIEIARYIEGQISATEIKGSLAFIAIQTNKKTNKPIKVFYGRNDNPLNLSKSRGKIRLSSEGEGSPIKEKILYSFDMKTYQITKRKLINIVAEKEEENDEDNNTKSLVPAGYNSYDGRDYNGKHYSQNDQERLEENYYEESGSEDEIFNEIAIFYDKLTDIDEIFRIDIEEEIEMLTQNIAMELREAYEKKKQMMLELEMEPLSQDIKKV